MIPQIQQLVVQDKKWMDEDEMLDCIAISQSMPGVIAINSATYIGKRIRGVKGSLAATLGVVMPSFIIIILAVTVLGAIGEKQIHPGSIRGCKGGCMRAHTCYSSQISEAKPEFRISVGAGYSSIHSYRDFRDNGYMGYNSRSCCRDNI